MYYVILMLLVSVSAREVPQLYNNGPNQESFERAPGLHGNLNTNNDRQHGFVNTNNHEQFNLPNKQFVNNDRNEERPFVDPPLGRNHGQENVNHYTENGFSNNPDQLNMQNNRQFVPTDNNKSGRNRNPQANQGHLQMNLNNREPFNGQSNREIPPDNNNNRNDRNWNPNTKQEQPYANKPEQSNVHNNRETIPNESNINDRPNAQREQSHDNEGIMNINLAFDRQDNRREHSTLNIPRQTYNINNEYSIRDDTNNRSTNRNNNRSDKYNENILHARRQQDGMTLDDYNRDKQKNTHTDRTHTHRSNPSDQSKNNGIVTFINNLNNTNQNRESQNSNRNNYRNQSGFKTDTVYNKPKVAIENEVTPNILEHRNVDKENRTVNNEDWVWGLEDTTTVSPVTVDDRAAFSGDKCSTGMTRFHGKCVPVD